MKNKTKKQYVMHISNTYLNNICAVKYMVGELVQVSIETNTGKTLAFEIMPHEKYEELEEKWTSDCYLCDARSVQRALKYFGMWEDEE